MEHVQPADAITFAETLLKSHGLSGSHAKIIAQCLVAADLRGVDTHGINRLPSYIAKIKKGAIDVKAEPELKQITPVVAQVDAKNAFGFIGAKLGMAKAIEMAEVFGIGMVSIKHSNHFGMSAWLVKQAIDADMLSLVFTNSSPALPPWGSVSKIVGVSPIACGAPGGDHPFILDMAPSNAARGKVYKALRRNEKIPKDWALNAAGEPTDDPKEALEGVMLPMGGPKGSGLAIMMDVFSGVLSGSAFAGGVKGPYDPSSDPADVGHFLVAIKPDLFMTKEEFVERAMFLYQKVTTSEKAAGVNRIYFPGEIEQLTEEKRRKEGIPYAESEVQTLNAEASSAGVPELKVSKYPCSEISVLAA